MKRVIIIALLLITVNTSLKAQPTPTLVIRNNTACDVEISVRAHDINTPTCALQSKLFTVVSGGSASFVDVTDINVPPNTIGWQSGTIAVTTNGQPTWDWDAVKFAAIPPSGSFGGQIGYTSACSSNTTLTFPNSCNTAGGPVSVTADWSVTGGNVLVSFN